MDNSSYNYRCDCGCEFEIQFENQIAVRKKKGSGTNKIIKVPSTLNFDLSEFHSKDGRKVPNQYYSNIQELMEQLEVIRKSVKRPIIINSGWRSVQHNKNVGGSPKSQHLIGRAADIRVVGMTAFQLKNVIESLIGSSAIKQGGLGQYPTFVHYDTRGKRARW